MIEAKEVKALPRNDGTGRPLSRQQRFEYWYVGYDDAREGLPPLRWMKQSWPEDGREAYYEGHEAGGLSTSSDGDPVSVVPHSEQ